MPKLDGLHFLEKVMTHFPTKTIVISGQSAKESQIALKALSLGAVDVLPKSDLDLSRGARIVSEYLLERIHLAAGIKSAELSSALPVSHSPLLLAIAASTGGPEAIKTVLTQLPPDIPPTLIVQHMPAFFTKSFAENLNSLCSFEVREARHGDPLQDGVALIAPGNYHMTVVKAAGRLCVSLNQNPLLHGVRPAADPLFESIAPLMGSRAIGVVLTGMGRDGAEGLLRMRQSGSYNIAQDEASCVVYSMPREAFEIGAVQIVSPLAKIASLIAAEITRRTVARAG
jgi:two-component system chemotaxis response regulator CheB